MAGRSRWLTSKRVDSGSAILNGSCPLAVEPGAWLATWVATLVTRAKGSLA